jgi:hypothetical protein
MARLRIVRHYVGLLRAALLGNDDRARLARLPEHLDETVAVFVRHRVE